jgi:hypothetical protein
MKLLDNYLAGTGIYFITIKLHRYDDNDNNNNTIRQTACVFRRYEFGPILALRLLLGVSENVTDSERKENRDFLYACMQTAPMQYVHRLLVPSLCHMPSVQYIFLRCKRSLHLPTRTSS